MTRALGTMEQQSQLILQQRHLNLTSKETKARILAWTLTLMSIGL